MGTNDRRHARATILLVINACIQKALIKKNKEVEYRTSYLTEFVFKDSLGTSAFKVK
jgi:hypothetical protein